MKKYFENLSLVELNSTFYQYPRPETVENWRKKVPQNFEFTVKAHQYITHKAKMKVNNTTIQSFEQMKQICKLLHSKVLLFQTPASFKPEKLADAEELFKKLNRENLILKWETRGSAWKTKQVRTKLAKTLKEVNVGHVTDPFIGLPTYVSKIAYFRLHGLGKRMYYYQYSNEELAKLKELVSSFEKKVKDVYVLFNNLSMLEDATRFSEYLSQGAFPKISSLTGADAIQNFIEKTKYPTTKSMLTRKIGWRIIETEQGKQIRLEAIFQKLPSKTYKNVDQLFKDLTLISRYI